MNTKSSSLLTLAALVLTAVAINASANAALFSPRAWDNRPKISSLATVDPNLTAGSQGLTVSPRAGDLRTKSTATPETLNFASGTCAVASPKQAERIGKTASASCCVSVASTTACTAPKACCAGK